MTYTTPHRCRRRLTCPFYPLTAEAHDRPANTSLRLFAVLTVPRKYDCARQTARAS